MRNFFATTPALDGLPSWEADPQVIASRQREQQLHADYDVLTRQVTEERRVDNGPYQGLVTSLSPAHRSWDTQRKREAKHAEWQTAHRELQRIERQAQDKVQQAGHDAKYRVWQEEVVPAIEQLIASLERLQHVCRRSTSARQYGSAILEPLAWSRKR
jgi:hypothetical protein